VFNGIVVPVWLPPVLWRNYRFESRGKLS